MENFATLVTSYWVLLKVCSSSLHWLISQFLCSFRGILKSISRQNLAILSNAFTNEHTFRWMNITVMCEVQCEAFYQKLQVFISVGAIDEAVVQSQQYIYSIFVEISLLGTEIRYGTALMLTLRNYTGITPIFFD